MKKYLYAFMLTSFVFGSCDNRSKEEKIVDLFQKIEQKIIAESDSFDIIKFESKKQFVSKLYFSENTLVREDLYLNDTTELIVETRYSITTKFEMRKELNDGIVSSKGILYDGKHYGPWEMFYENSNKLFRGFRYNGNNIGNRIYYYPEGNIKETRIYGNDHLLDSLLLKFSKM